MPSVPAPAVDDHTLKPRLVRGIEKDGRERRVVLDDQHERFLAELVAVVIDLKSRRECGGNIAPLFSNRAGVPSVPILPALRFRAECTR